MCDIDSALFNDFDIIKCLGCGGAVDVDRAEAFIDYNTKRGEEPRLIHRRNAWRPVPIGDQQLRAIRMFNAKLRDDSL